MGNKGKIPSSVSATVAAAGISRTTQFSSHVSERWKRWWRTPGSSPELKRRAVDSWQRAWNQGCVSCDGADFSIRNSSKVVSERGWLRREWGVEQTYLCHRSTRDNTFYLSVTCKCRRRKNQTPKSENLPTSKRFDIRYIIYGGELNWYKARELLQLEFLTVGMIYALTLFLARCGFRTWCNSLKHISWLGVTRGMGLKDYISQWVSHR